MLWLLAAVEVLGTPHDLTTWEAFLSTIDGTLPLTSAANSKICYYFDVSQTCSADAIGTLLSQAAVDLLTWVPTPADCSALLEEQRIYADKVASSVFSAAIASAASATVTNFELLAQSWVLRAGHYPLTYTHAAFVAALNSISDWTTVKCDGENLMFHGQTTPKPGFLGNEDCNVLGAVYYVDPCDSSTCTLTEGADCCLQSFSYTCCNVHNSNLASACNQPSCSVREFCCQYASESSPCCAT